jgi:hypothetical protein
MTTSLHNLKSFVFDLGHNIILSFNILILSESKLSNLKLFVKMVPVPFVILLRASYQQSSTVLLLLDIMILLAIEAIHWLVRQSDSA